MRDKGTIIAGLAVLCILVTFPFWYALAPGEDVPRPELPPPEDGEHCVEDAVWMRAHHMELLDQWRNEVVRGDSKAQYHQSTAFPEDKPWEKSLTKTCLTCHTMEVASKGKRSCVQCHNYADVQPRCMDCHVEPKGN